MARVAVVLTALVAVARLFVGCPEAIESPEPMIVAACGPVEERVDTAYFQVGPSIIPSGLPVDLTTAWFIGATRPDCAADLEVGIEPVAADAQDIPPGLMEAQVAVSCFNAPSRVMTVNVPVAQVGPRALTVRYHIDGAPPCMDDEHRAAAAYFGQPFSPVTVQVRLAKSASAPIPKAPHFLVATTKFRHSTFDSWRIGKDAGSEAGDSAAKLVRIVKPSDGDMVENPVTFTVNASPGVARVKLVADGKYELGAFDPAKQSDLQWTFGTLGRRAIRATGYDTSGKEVASHGITVWIIKKELVANTYYYVAQESDYDGGTGAWTLPGAGCKALSVDGGGPLKLTTSFFYGACIEGTAKLTSGELFNYTGDCPSCAQADNTCPALGTAGPRTKCWEQVDAVAYPWGKGASTVCPRDAGSGSCPLVPLESWATDPNFISFGTTLYAEGWDGKVLPAAGGVPARTHDGCFRADDRGKKITGSHVDIFAGSRQMQRYLEGLFPSVPEPYVPNMPIQLHHKKCDYLKASP